MPHLLADALGLEGPARSDAPARSWSKAPPQTTYYRYDAAGERVRKVTDTQSGARARERIYLGALRGLPGIRGRRRRDPRTPDAPRHRRRPGASASSRRRRSTRQRPRRERHPADAGRATSSPTSSARPCSSSTQSAAIITYEEYYPYGSTSFQSGRSAAEVSLKRYRYTGKERDEESGLYYHGARYYAPWLGRWTTARPGRLRRRANLYAYCRDNPVTMHDPTGTQGTAGDDDGPPLHYEEAPPDPSGRPTPGARLVIDPPTFPPLVIPPLKKAAGDASVPFPLSFYNSPGILGPNTSVMLTQPNVSFHVTGQHGLQFPSAVPGSPAASYLTLTFPTSIGQSQVSVGPDSAGHPTTLQYQHQLGPSDPARSTHGWIFSGSAALSGIAGLTTDPTLISLGATYLHEWTFGGETEHPAGSFGLNAGGGGGRGLSLTTGGMGWYGDVSGSVGASLFPFGYYHDTPAANADYTGPRVEPSQVPRLTLSGGLYATGFLGDPIDSLNPGGDVGGRSRWWRGCDMGYATVRRQQAPLPLRIRGLRRMDGQFRWQERHRGVRESRDWNPARGTSKPLRFRMRRPHVAELQATLADLLGYSS